MTLFIYVFSISILVLFKEISLFEFLFLDAQNTLKIKKIIKLDPKIKKRVLLHARNAYYEVNCYLLY